MLQSIDLPPFLKNCVSAHLLLPPQLVNDTIAEKDHFLFVDATDEAGSQIRRSLLLAIV
jgi:hypothetical protein